MASVACVGIATLDEVWTIEAFPDAGTKTRASQRTVVGGGVAANASVTVARLGGQATFSGPLGDDDAASEIAVRLDREGVAVGFVPRLTGESSPISVVLIDAAGERTIINHAGAHLYTTAPTPEPAVFDHADAVMTDVRWPAGATVALRAASHRGVPAVVDCDHDPSQLTELLAAASHVIFSQPVLEQFTGIAGPECLFAVAGITRAWVAATSGDQGVHWIEEGTLRHHPATPVEAVDTLGAGDVFSGSFTLLLAEGAQPGEAISFAADAAALKCTRSGGREGIPTRDEVEAFRSPA